MRSLLIYIGIPALLIVLIASIYGTGSTETYSYSEIISYFRNQQVEMFELDLGDGKMQISLKEGVDATPQSKKIQDEERMQNQENGVDSLWGMVPGLSNSSDEPTSNIINYTAPDSATLYAEIKPFIDKYNENHPDSPMLYNLDRPAEENWLLSYLPMIIISLGFLALFWFIMRKTAGEMGMDGRQMGFGKSKAKNISDEKRKTTFDDVAGADEEKEELAEIVEFLKNPKKFNDIGARIPKGVLLVGPPGTGKTLLARAVAGEAGVPFFFISGSDFVEMFVGVGASRVRDLFQKAKEKSPSIVFIDEIDAVGRQRGAGLGGGHDEREQTLNQLLVEMDGFGANEGVIIIAATNRPDILDKALMRPGRFDRQIAVSAPDVKGREEILKVHAKGKPLAPDVDLKTVAKTTAGFTGADLENLLNEAALLCARKGLKAITMPELEEAAIKVVVGTEKKSRRMSEREKKLTAYHEAGHALATYYCETQDKVHQISIIPRGLAGGYTMSLPEEDKSYRSKTEMEEEIIVLLGGRVAEALIIGDISTGASNDIERATKLATAMITKYGMSEKLGPINYGNNNEEVFLGRDMGHVKNYSEKIASDIDEEISKVIRASYDKTETILHAHEHQLHQVAKFLIEKEKMSGEEFESIMNQSQDK